MKVLAEDIRSMRIQLSMQDVGIERTVANIRKSFSTLKSEVSSSNKMFNYGEKSVDSYKKHISELSSAQSASQKNLDDLTRKYHEVGEKQGYASDQALTLQRSISEQEKELHFLTRELDQANKGLKEFQKNQAIDNSKFTKIGKTFESMGSSIRNVSQRMGEVGTSLTNKITKPALVAGTAMAGITAKLGFDRLVGLDSAKAKLEGLGYSTKEVGRITDQVTKAIDGGMTTMAEGTDVAAGALASGVKEGKELEKYIKLVGDAAVGANRPVSDMAMIFNRVQGQGKLMTQELNMIEEGMPGFSKAMAKHLGVSYEAFREMVTEGKVSSEEFLTVMDDFAGGMAKSYSKSWQGMVQNTKAYIGQIGESLLSGVFQQAKGSLHEFEKLLRSDAAQKWAKDTGAKLANAFTTMSNGIKGVLKWWNGLDSSTQKTLGNIAKYSAISLVAVGPLLKVFSKLGMVISGVFGPFGKLLKFFGKLGPEAKAAGSLLGGLTNIVPKLGTAIGLLSNPVGWITLGVGALVGVFGVAYAKSEKFRNAINGLLNIFKVFGGGIINTVVGSLKKLNGWFKDLDNTINDNVNGALKKWYDNLPDDDLLKQTGNGLKSLKEAFEGVAKGISNSTKKASDTVKVLGKGVSKETKKALGDYVNYSEESTGIMENIKNSHNKITDKQANDLISKNKKMHDELVDQFEKRKQKEIKIAKKSLEDGLLTQEQYEQVEKATNDHYEKQKKKASEYTQKMVEILKRRKDGELSQKDIKEYENLLKKQNEVGVRELSKGEKEQEKILRRMSVNRKAMSVEEASEIIKKSNESLKAAKKTAQDRLDQRLEEIENMKGLSESEKEDYIQIAKDKYNEEVKTAEGRHKDIKDGVVKNNKSIEEEMDLSNGKVYNNAEKWWNKTKKFLSDDSIWEGIKKGSSGLGQWFSEQGTDFAKHFQRGWNIATEAGGNLWDWIQRSSGNIGGWFVQKGGNLWNSLKFGWLAAIEVGGNLWTTLTTKLNETWETTKQGFTQFGGRLWSSIKQGWNIALTNTGNILLGLVGKLGEWWETTKGFFSGLGQKMGGALKRGWNSTMTNVGSFFGNLWQTIQIGMGTVRGVLIGLWQGISGTVVNIVKGMGAGIAGAFQSIWGSAQRTFGILRGWLQGLWTGLSGFVVGKARSIWKGTTGAFSNLWGSTRTIFGTLRGWLSGLWSGLRTTVVNKAKGIWDGVSKNFRNLWGSTKSIFGTLRGWLNGLWTGLRTSVVNKAKSLWKGVSGAFSNLWKNTKSIFSTLKGWLNTTWQNIRNSVVKKATSLWTGTRDKFKRLWGSVKSITGTLRGWVIGAWETIRDKVTGLAEKVRAGVTAPFRKMKEVVQNILGGVQDFIEKMTGSVKKGLNGVVKGMNKIGSFIGIKSDIPTLSTGTHSTHTQDFVTNGSLNQDTMAIVGDKGKGNGPRGFRHEMIEDNKGNLSLTPNKDTLVPLKEGYKVHNGKSTHDFLSNMFGTSNPKFSNGTTQSNVPRFSVGSFLKKGWDGLKGIAGKGADWFKDQIGDIMDWVKKPKELLDKMLDAFGVDGFKSMTGHIGKITRGAFGRLKNGLVEQIKDWFTEAESGGDGDAAWLLKHPILQRFGKYTGGLMFNGGNHYGIDFGMPTGTKIRALTDGRITQSGAVSGGGGNQITLREPGGKYFQWYMHMSKLLAKKGDNVKTGDVIGLSGNTGNSTTPHLHIQRMKGYPSNDTAQSTVLDWLKNLGGGKKSANKWKSDIKKAAKQMKVNLSGGELNDIAKLIGTESGGNPSVMQQVHDVNSGKNAARGLLQYTPSTFASYAAKGKKNIMNGYHQLLAFFNNSSWRSNLSSWKRRMAAGSTGWGPTGSRRFATGGIIGTDGLYQLAEDGHPEAVLSLDPKRATDTMKLMGYVQSKLKGKDKNKRPNQVSSKYGKTYSSSNDRELELMAQQLEATREQNQLLMKILGVSQNIEKQPKGYNEKDVSRDQGKRAQMMSYNMGGAF